MIKNPHGYIERPEVGKDYVDDKGRPVRVLKVSLILRGHVKGEKGRPDRVWLSISRLRKDGTCKRGIHWGYSITRIKLKEKPDVTADSIGTTE